MLFCRRQGKYPPCSLGKEASRDDDDGDVDDDDDDSASRWVCRHASEPINEKK